MLRGEIWLINLDPTIGAEIRKTRPAVIINEDRIGILPLRILVPLMDWKDRYAIAPWMVEITPTPENRLSKNSAIDACQVRSVSTEHLVQRLGWVTTTQLNQIVNSIQIVIGAEK